MSLAKELLYTKKQLSYLYTLIVGSNSTSSRNVYGYYTSTGNYFGSLEPTEFENTIITQFTTSITSNSSTIELRFQDSMRPSAVELTIEFQETNNSYKLVGVGDWDRFYFTSSSIPDMQNHSILHARIYVSVDTSWDD